MEDREKLLSLILSMTNEEAKMFAAFLRDNHDDSARGGKGSK